MKKAHFSDSQILAILKQAENDVPTLELCREHGMSNSSFYKWRSKYGGIKASLFEFFSIHDAYPFPIMGLMIGRYTI